jgi:hypothetical protein
VPGSEVIQKVGERVAELVTDVNRIDATERVTLEELSTLGRPLLAEKRNFDYLVSIQ